MGKGKGAKDLSPRLGLSPDDSGLARFRYFGMEVAMQTFGARDHISRVLLNEGTFYEIDLLREIRRRYIPGTAIVDVGANIGNHTVFCSLVLGAKRVYSFEPLRASSKLLRENVRMNGVSDRVTIFEQAVSDRKGVGRIVGGTFENEGLAKFRFSSSGTVKANTLDSTLPNEPISVLKIDVEGSELAVLRGGSDVISKWHPDIFVEASDEGRFVRVANFLDKHEYAFDGRFCYTPSYLFRYSAPRARLRCVLKQDVRRRQIMANSKRS